IEKNPADLETLMTTTLSGKSATVEEGLRELILVIGENMKVRRFVRYTGNVASYVHGGGRIGVLASFALGDNAAAAKDDYKDMAKDIAMQIAAIPPAYLDEASVPAEVVAKEKEIMLVQMENDEKTKGKPAAVKEKMIEGKIKKYFKENCLVDQAFIKDGNLSVSQFVDEVAKKLGTTVAIKEYVRFEKGEGIEKREDNFADEVASMMK
ncbi:MAG: translation elongation factor Ts, partial [Angelakisella sp.]